MVKPDQTVDVRKVTVGVMQGQLASLQAGLNPGEIVVTDGVDKLQQGSRVRVVPGSNATAQNDSQ